MQYCLYTNQILQLLDKTILFYLQHYCNFYVIPKTIMNGVYSLILSIYANITDKIEW